MPPYVRADDMPASQRPRVSAMDLLLVLMALIWGANVSVVKFGTGAVAPLAYNGVRMIIAISCLLPISMFAVRSRPARSDVVALLWLGVLGHGAYQLLFIEGVARTRAGDAALLLAGTPALIAILSWHRGIERLGVRGALGVALSTVGIALVVVGTHRGGAEGSSLLGDALVVASGATWATFTILLKPYADRVDPVHVAAITMAGGIGPLLLICAPAMRQTDWVHLPGLVWSAIAFSSVFALVIAYLLWYRGVRVLGPTRASMYGNLQPIFGLVFAWLMLGEFPTVLQGVGAGSIVGGLLLTRS